MGEDVRMDKRARIDDPVVAPLNALVRSWRSADDTALIPWFDPDDGGVAARLLVLMESPAPRTVANDGSGFCSQDNVDRSNRCVATSFASAGISRLDCVKWNVVPWALRDDGDHPRAPRQRDLELAAPALREVLALTPDVDVVLTLGNAALSGFMLAVTGEPFDTLYRVVAAPHPSQRNTAASAFAIRRIDNACRTIAAHLEKP